MKQAMQNGYRVWANLWETKHATDPFSLLVLGALVMSTFMFFEIHAIAGVVLGVTCLLASSAIAYEMCKDPVSPE